MEATAVTAAIAPRAWAERNDCNLSLRWRGPLVARAIVFRAFLPHPSRYCCNCLLFLLAYPFRLSIAGGGCVSRVDFDQYAGQYEAILAAQTNFFDGDSGYFARYKIELAQQLVGPINSILDFGCGVGRSMPYLREVFPKAEIVGCDPSAESLAIARRENPSCRFTCMDELTPDAKLKEAGSSSSSSTIRSIRSCVIWPRIVRSTDAVLRSMRETVERMRNAHSISTSRAIACSLAARRASPVREISSLAAHGRPVFRLRLQSKARRRLIAALVSSPGPRARSGTF
jgi:SAM-dependent methyltransferase